MMVAPTSPLPSIKSPLHSSISVFAFPPRLLLPLALNMAVEDSVVSPACQSELTQRNQTPSPASPTKSSVRFRLSDSSPGFSAMKAASEEISSISPSLGNGLGINAPPDDSRAFYEFQQRRDKAGEPLYVLLCCWVAAVGAGLLKSEEILEGVTRVSILN